MVDECSLGSAAGALLRKSDLQHLLLKETKPVGRKCHKIVTTPRPGYPAKLQEFSICCRSQRQPAKESSGWDLKRRNWERVPQETLAGASQKRLDSSLRDVQSFATVGTWSRAPSLLTQQDQE
jgi:hypothetical protein